MKNFTVIITKDEDWYVIRCKEFRVTTQGKTIKEAMYNIIEATELYLEVCYSFSLEEVELVEQFIRQSKKDYTIKQLWKQLANKMHYLTFDAIINYLLEDKIVLSRKGYIIWIWDPEGIKKYYRYELMRKSDNFLMVEEFLKNMNESVIKFKNLKRKLPKKVSNKKLNEILENLEDFNRITIGSKGITWIYNNNKKLKRLIKKAKNKNKL